MQGSENEIKQFEKIIQDFNTVLKNMENKTSSRLSQLNSDKNNLENFCKKLVEYVTKFQEVNLNILNQYEDVYKSLYLQAHGKLNSLKLDSKKQSQVMAIKILQELNELDKYIDNNEEYEKYSRLAQNTKVEVDNFVKSLSDKINKIKKTIIM
jgi:hypothetical protein